MPKKTNNFTDLPGRKINHWTFISNVKEDQWLARCDCGKEKIIYAYSVKKGQSKSCGCHARKLQSISKTTHGLSHQKPYRAWTAMKKRCYNKKTDGYSLYGGRGIRVCDRWRNSFINFWDDMKDGHKDNLSLDRIDTNGNYCKENCRWATLKEQARNKRKTKMITYNGMSKPLAEWSEILGINYFTIQSRLARGADVYTAFNRPLGERRKKH